MALLSLHPQIELDLLLLNLFLKLILYLLIHNGRKDLSQLSDFVDNFA